MTGRHSRRPDHRHAYRRAWQDRQETGETGDAVLLRRLRLEGSALDPGAEELLLGLWRRGVPPSRMSWEFTKLGWGVLRQLGSLAVEIVGTFRGAGAPVPFRPIASPEDLRRLLGAEAPGEGGSIHVEVLFDVESCDSPTALVRWDEAVIASAELSADQWNELSAARAWDEVGGGVAEVRGSTLGPVLVALSYDGLDGDEDDDEPG